MRVLLWIIGVPVLLLIAAAVLLPLFIDERALVALAAEKIEAQSGVKLKIDGEASLSLFPRVSLATTGVTVEIPDSSTHIEAQSLRAGVALMPLLRRSVEIDSIVVSGLTLRTLASDDSAQVTAALDTSNMSNAELDAFYAARKQLRLSAQAEAAADLLAAPMALEVGELSLRDIRLITVDAAGKTISELQLNYLTASDLNTDGRPVPLSLQLLIPGDADAAPVDVTLEVQFTADLDAEKVTLTELALVVSGATPDTIRLSAEGSFAMDTQVADLNLELA
ncbi:MAG: AsmA protein, partial [Halieaceae bacterium]